ncbi:MAG: hypothetical protein HYR63_14775 [Proteobacteria bacterium]|nr:hypothetical protein [Pseudomonadota bacterium]
MVSKLKLPAGVKRFELQFGDDSTGDPAVWVLFIIDDDLNPSPKKVSEFSKLAQEVTADLLAKLPKKGIERWPYVQFRAAA